MAYPKNTAELVLHPVRMRIIHTLLGQRELTTAEVAAELSDVSKATIYRQIAILAEAGVLSVVGERRVRGAVERTYRLDPGQSEVTLEDLESMTAEQHKQAFVAFIAGVLADYDAYLDRGDIDLLRDRVGYRQHALWLTDDEMDELLAKHRETLAPYVEREPAPGRVRRLLSTILMPAVRGEHSQS